MYLTTWSRALFTLEWSIVSIGQQLSFYCLFFVFLMLCLHFGFNISLFLNQAAVCSPERPSLYYLDISHYHSFFKTVVSFPWLPLFRFEERKIKQQYEVHRYIVKLFGKKKKKKKSPSNLMQTALGWIKKEKQPKMSEKQKGIGNQWYLRRWWWWWWFRKKGVCDDGTCFQHKQQQRSPFCVLFLTTVFNFRNTRTHDNNHRHSTTIASHDSPPSSTLVCILIIF